MSRNISRPLVYIAIFLQIGSPILALAQYPPAGPPSVGVSSVDLSDGYTQAFDSDYSYSSSLGVPYGYSYVRGDLGQLNGDNGNNVSAGFFLPIYNGDESIFFADGRANWLQGNIGANGGFGYRRMVFDSRTILGANVFYDGQESDLGNWYSQIGAGLEVWHPTPLTLCCIWEGSLDAN